MTTGVNDPVDACHVGQVVVLVGEALHRRENHREIFRLGAGHHRVDRDLFDGRRAVLRRHLPDYFSAANASSPPASPSPIRALAERSASRQPSDSRGTARSVSRGVEEILAGHLECWRLAAQLLLWVKGLASSGRQRAVSASIIVVEATSRRSAALPLCWSARRRSTCPRAASAMRIPGMPRSLAADFASSINSLVVK